MRCQRNWVFLSDWEYSCCIKSTQYVAAKNLQYSIEFCINKKTIKRAGISSRMRPQVWKRGNNPKNLILEVRNYMFEFGEVALVRLYRATEPKFSAPGIRHCKGKEVFETDWSATSDDLSRPCPQQTLASINSELDLLLI